MKIKYIYLPSIKDIIVSNYVQKRKVEAFINSKLKACMEMETYLKKHKSLKEQMSDQFYWARMKVVQFMKRLFKDEA